MKHMQNYIELAHGYQFCTALCYNFYFLLKLSIYHTVSGVGRNCLIWAWFMYEAHINC